MNSRDYTESPITWICLPVPFERSSKVRTQLNPVSPLMEFVQLLEQALNEFGNMELLETFYEGDCRRLSSLRDKIRPSGNDCKLKELV